MATTSNFDFSNRTLYSEIAQLRIGYAKLNDYLQNIGASDSKINVNAETLKPLNIIY